MPDTATPLLWFMAVASACLGLLVSNAPTPHQTLPSHHTIPWWQDIAARYRLHEGSHVTPAYPADDCLEVNIKGEGFHRQAFYELTCSPTLLLATSNGQPQQRGEITVLQPLPPELFVDPYELKQLAAVKAGIVKWELFGHVDLEQPAPACHPTVLALTLRNVTKHPQRRGARPRYHAVEVPFHTKYPAPVSGGPGCASDRSLLDMSPGPFRAVTWPAPVLLQRTEPLRASPGPGGGDGGDADAQDAPDGTLAAEPVPPPAGAASASRFNAPPSPLHEARPHQAERPEHQEGLDGGSGGGGGGDTTQWSTMGVRLALPEVVAVPAGCRLHAGWVSLLTLASALMCSGAVVAAAWC